MTDHPITPPTELVQQWKRTAPHQSNEHEHYHYITLCAAEWGADQELEACIAWMIEMGYWGEDGQAIPLLRAARRPKPPSLKEQALHALGSPIMIGESRLIGHRDHDLLRRALEALPDD